MGDETAPQEHRSYPKSVQAGIPRLTPTPEGWSVLRMENLLNPVRRRVRVEPHEEYQLVTARRSRGGIVERERKLGQDILTETQFHACTDDFLISRRQIAHGACGIVPEWLNGSLVSNEYATLRPTNRLDAGFLRHLPNSIYFQQTCFHSSIGVHVEKLVFSLEDWLRWQFNVPPIPEQRRVTAVLDAWDDVITLSERLTAAKRRQRAGVAQHLLYGDRRNTRLLGEVVAINPPMPRLVPDAVVSFVAMEDVSEDGRLMRHVPRGRAELGGGYTPFQDDDVLVAKITPCFENGKGAFAQGLHGGVGYGSTEFHVVRAGPEILPRFVYHHTLTADFRRNGERTMTGSAGQRRVPASFIEDYRLTVPPSDVQEKTVRLLDALTDEIDLLAARTDLLRRQKHGLMQRLLTGEVRVPESVEALMPGPAREAAE